MPVISPALECFTFSKKQIGINDNTIQKMPNLIEEMSFTFIVDGNGGGFDIKGIKTRDVIQQIKLNKNKDEIVKALEDKYSEKDVKTIIANLAFRGIIVSAEHKMENEYATFWCECGISPLFAQEFIQKLKVNVISLNGNQKQIQKIKNEFINIGASVVEKNEDIVIVIVDDYLQNEVNEFNEKRTKDKKQWMPIQMNGIEYCYGPIFNTNKKSACLKCITNNMRNNREMRSFLSYHIDGALVSRKKSKVEKIIEVSAISIILKILLFLMTEQQAKIIKKSKTKRSQEYIQNYNKLEKLNDYLISQNIATGKTKKHYVNKRPQCLTCGDPKLTNPAREPTIPDLFAQNSQSVFTSGGMKAKTPQETFNQYKHLISPLTGIITAIERSSPPDDPWMHVYWAGSNLAIKNKNFRALNTSIRSKSAGKGRSDEQAKASALGEAVERYSGVFNGDEIRKIAKFNDFKNGDAVHPNDIMLFSDKQYKMKKEIENKQYRFYSLPQENFDPNAEVEWSPVWSISQQKHKWIMTYQLYFSYEPENKKLNRNFANPDSNGAAAGNTHAEAFVQGFMELVERDAYAIWWYNKIQYPQVDIKSFNDPYINMAIERYKKIYNRNIWVIDITNDFKIPVFVAISKRTDKQKQDICIAAGAHFNPHIALLRAVCELNQYISAVLKSTDENDSYTYFDKECNQWWQNHTTESEPYLMPDKKQKIITKNHYPIIKRNQHQETQECINAVHKKNMEIMILDQTRPDIKIPVIKVIVPGMRHFWARFKKGRLYEVPVKLGKLKKEKKEEELNPIPVFI